MARKPVFIPEIQGDNVNMSFVELMQRLLRVKVEEKVGKKKKGKAEEKKKDKDSF